MEMTTATTHITLRLSAHWLNRKYLHLDVTMLCPYPHSGGGRAAMRARVWKTLAAVEEIKDIIAELTVEGRSCSSLPRSMELVMSLRRR